MKRCLVLGEGLADEPVAEWNGRTPLQVAHAPYASRLARRGRSGLLMPVREGEEGRSEATLAAILGVPVEAALGLRRGPIEAASLPQGAGDFTFAYAGNFVTLDGEWLRQGRVRGLRLVETQALAGVLDRRWKAQGIAVEVIAPGRVVLLCRPSEPLPMGYPPCLAEGERLDEYVPGGRAGGFLREMLEDSAQVLEAQTVNAVRLDMKEDPANGLWLWGGGFLADAKRVWQQARRGGVMLTQSPLARGAARLSGMRVCELRDPWGLAPGEVAFRAAELASALASEEFLMVYWEAPQGLGGYGPPKEKARAIDQADYSVLGPLMELLEGFGRYRLVLAADGGVSALTGRPLAMGGPLVLAGEGVSPDGTSRWDEAAAAQGALGRVKPEHVLRLLEGER